MLLFQIRKQNQTIAIFVINILVYFLLRQLNWVEGYSTMKIGRFFFV